jgi:release factor glutamine methyltransferase
MQGQECRALLQELAEKLLPVCDGQAEAQVQAWLLLEHVTSQSKASLLAKNSLALSAQQIAQLQNLVHQRVATRKPLQYLLGTVPFCGLSITVRPPTLIPRPETEEWVTWLLDQLAPVANQSLRVLDLCTGSGCIALALAKGLTNAQVTGVDIAPTAVALARENALKNNLHNVNFVCADLWAGLPVGECYDLIVANPPYITNQEYEQLDPELLLWEDPVALTASNQGLAVYQAIAKNISNRLVRGGALAKASLPVMVVELGTAPEAVRAVFAEKGFSALDLKLDMHGVFRWLVALI